jgi:signal peptide peptidase SppA
LGRGRLPDNSNETTDAVLSSPTEARTSLDAESSPLPRHTSEQDEEEERGAATAANRSTTTTIDQKSAPSSSLDPVAPAPELTPPNTTTASPDTTTLIHTTTAAEEEPVTTTISSLSAATPNGNTTALPVDDSTTTESPSSPSQQQPQQQQVLVLGGTPYRVMRPGRHASAGAVPPAMPRPSPQTGLLFAELAAAFLQTGFRLWILTFLTSRLSHQEETILPIQRFVWERLNDRYTRDSSALASVVHAPPLGVSKRRWRRQHVRHHHHLHHLTTTSRPPALLPTTLRETFTRTVVVVPLEADKLDVEYLTDVISFLVQQHRAHAFGSQPRKHVQPKWWWQQQEGKGNNQTREEVEEEQLFPKELEVVLLVKSGGGSVHSFGLAAAQVRRLAREPNIRLTASVDMYAASGGYMIASQAHRLLAAPFALLGSIGVIVETLNFNEIARKYGIHPVTIKSGNNKNPLSTYGAITAKDEREEQQRLVKVHEAFKELVVEGRPVLADSIHKVADGSVFAGQEALDTQLIDQIQTSEEYIMERIQAGDRVLRLHRSIKPKFTRRVHLSPLDILPHLRTWLGEWGLLARLQDPSVLLTLTSALEMVRHLVRQYGDSLGGV